MRKDEVFDDQGNVVSSVDVPYTETEKLNYLREYAAQIMDGGIVVAGIPVKTTEGDRSMIAGAVTRAVLDNNDALTYEYFPPGGTPILLTNAHFKTIGLATATHVQLCLSVKAQIQSEIETYDDLVEIKDAFDEGMSE